MPIFQISIIFRVFYNRYLLNLYYFARHIIHFNNLNAMKQYGTHILSLAAGALLLFTSACTTSRVSQQLSTEQTAVAKQLSSEIENTKVETVAAAQTSEDAVQPFSASKVYTQATAANSQPTEELLAANTDRKAAIRSLREQVSQQKMSFPKRVLVNTALKKMEKMQTKLEVKKIKAAKKGKEIPGEYRTPIIVGVIGLALIVLGAFGIPALYLLGSLILAAAVIWIILILAEVI